MQKDDLQQRATSLIERRSTEELKVVVDLLTNLQNRQAGNTAQSVEPDVEITIKEIMKDYERAWKTLAKREAVLRFSRTLVCNTFLVQPTNYGII